MKNADRTKHDRQPEESLTLTRRNMLASAMAGAGISLLPNARLQAAPDSNTDRKRPMLPSELKKKLRGPIMAIPTSFTKDDDIDFDGVRNMIKNGLEHGIKVFELTAGDSQYHALSYEEIKQLTRVMVESVGHKGVAIAATNAWWTERTLDYAKFAESIGADGVQILAPRGNEDSHFEHYQHIARHTRLGILLHGKFSQNLMHRFAAIDSIVAMKEDITEKYMFDMQRKFGDRFAIFGGGQKWRFLVGHRYGMKGYLSTFATFAPQIATKFWERLENGDLQGARDIVLKYDAPLFDFCLSGKRPFHAYWRAILEHFGLASRYLRKPEPTCTDEDMTDVKQFLNELDLTA